MPTRTGFKPSDEDVGRARSFCRYQEGQRVATRSAQPFSEGAAMTDPMQAPTATSPHWPAAGTNGRHAEGVQSDDLVVQLDGLRHRLATQPVIEQSKGILMGQDRKSTRLNSSHANISYAVFCLKKKKTQHYRTRIA